MNCGFCINGRVPFGERAGSEFFYTVSVWSVAVLLALGLSILDAIIVAMRLSNFVSAAAILSVCTAAQFDSLSTRAVPVGTSTDKCGANAKGLVCAAGYCCSQYGYVSALAHLRWVSAKLSVLSSAEKHLRIALRAVRLNSGLARELRLVRVRRLRW